MWVNGFPQGNGYYWVNYVYKDRTYTVVGSFGNRYNHVLTEDGVKRWRETHFTILLGRQWKQIKRKRNNKKLYVYDKDWSAKEIEIENFKHWDEKVELIPNIPYENISTTTNI